MALGVGRFCPVGEVVLCGVMVHALLVRTDETAAEVAARPPILPRTREDFIDLFLGVVLGVCGEHLEGSHANPSPLSFKLTHRRSWFQVTLTPADLTVKKLSSSKKEQVDILVGDERYSLKEKESVTIPLAPPY